MTDRPPSSSHDRSENRSTTRTSVFHGPIRKVTIGIIIAVSSTAIESLSISVALPFAVEDLGGMNLFGWAFSAFFLTMSVGMALGGNLSDNRGPSFPFLLGIIFFCVGLLLGGFANSMLLLIAGRVIQGFGAGLSNAGTFAIVAAYYGDSVRPKVLAMLSSAWAIPSLLGPSWAAVMVSYLSWRWVFLALVIPSITASILVASALTKVERIGPGNAPLTKLREESKWSLLKFSLTMAIGIALFSVSVILLNKFGNFIWTMLALLGFLAVILGIIGILRTRSITFGLTLFLMVFVNLSFFGIDGYIPLSVQIIGTHYQSWLGGASLTAAGLCWVSGSWLQSHLIEKTGRRVLVVVGGILTTIGILLTSMTVGGTFPILYLLLFWGMAGGGMGLAYNTLILIAMETANPKNQGEEVAIVQLAGVLGMALGTSIGSIIFSSSHSLESIQPKTMSAFYFFLGLVLAVALPIAFKLESFKKNKESQQTVALK